MYITTAEYTVQKTYDDGRLVRHYLAHKFEPRVLPLTIAGAQRILRREGWSGAIVTRVQSFPTRRNE